jgi:hypothetical protein
VKHCSVLQAITESPKTAIVDDYTGTLIDEECWQPRLPMIHDPLTVDHLARLGEFPLPPTTARL